MFVCHPSFIYFINVCLLRISAVIFGMLGFDKDPEVHHVNEISRKLATFTIDTDTNSSIHTGSDLSDSTETESLVDRYCDWPLTIFVDLIISHA